MLGLRLNVPPNLQNPLQFITASWAITKRFDRQFHTILFTFAGAFLIIIHKIINASRQFPNHRVSFTVRNLLICSSIGSKSSFDILSTIDGIRVFASSASAQQRLATKESAHTRQFEQINLTQLRSLISFKRSSIQQSLHSIDILLPFKPSKDFQIILHL